MTRSGLVVGDFLGEEQEDEQEEEEESMVATAGGEESSPPVPLPVATTTIRAFDVELARVISRREEMKGLTNEAECIQLQQALIACVNSWKSKK